MYVDYYGLLDKTYNPNQIYIQSTAVDRTLQSGYSELLGLYPPGTGGQRLTEKQAESLSDKAMPPLRIRAGNSFQQLSGLQQDLVQVPIFNFISDSVYDIDSCVYADLQYSDYSHNHPEIFDDLTAEIMPIVRHPLAVSQNYTDAQEQKMTFKNGYSIADRLKTEIFEGVPHSYYFTPEQWSNVRTLQKWVLMKPYLDSSRAMAMSKILLYPLMKMQARVNLLLLGPDITDDVKYVMNSAHDDQIANLVYWLNGVDYQFTDVPYASSVIFELHYNSTCLAGTTKDESCFSVHTSHDGKPLAFDTCLENNAIAGSKSKLCSYPDFKAYMAKISPKGDVRQLCAQKYFPSKKDDKEALFL